MKSLSSKKFSNMKLTSDKFRSLNKAVLNDINVSDEQTVLQPL